MNLKTRNEMIQKYQAEQMEILQRKGHDYAAGEAEVNGNENFRIIAELLKGAPMDETTVWAVYFLKPVLSVVTFVRTRRVESEGMEGRMNDIAKYANIFRTLLDGMN